MKWARRRAPGVGIRPFGSVSRSQSVCRFQVSRVTTRQGGKCTGIPNDLFWLDENGCSLKYLRKHLLLHKKVAPIFYDYLAGAEGLWGAKS
jgi:hypothetical protein